MAGGDQELPDLSSSLPASPGGYRGMDHPSPVPGWPGPEPVLDRVLVGDKFYCTVYCDALFAAVFSIQSLCLVLLSILVSWLAFASESWPLLQECLIG